MSDHTRELTYPAVISLLEDGQWHTDDELRSVTPFPGEWLREVERERRLERHPASPQLVRLADTQR